MPPAHVYIERARRQGPCLFCAQPGASARHRLWDAVDFTLRLDGMSPAEVAKDRSMDVGEVRWVAEAFARARKAHRPLPGRDVFTAQEWRELVDAAEIHGAHGMEKP